jgi:ubiquinone/menaquinone biosynthesis C-methylase UbiE
MTDNTQRFTGRAEDYDRYRQRYPAAEILERLRAWCSLAPNWLVADIGAGTGMLSEAFLENGNRVIAIEPNLDMRNRMHTHFANTPQLEIVDATAEATTLPGASVDVVAAGRAFHWFDPQRALAEFRRILKPGGWVVLVSQGRTHQVADLAPADRTPAFTQQTVDFEQLLTEYGTDYQRVRSGYRIHDNMRELFGPEAELHQAQLHGVQQLDWPAFRGHSMSLSVIPQPDHPNYEAFQRELRLYFDAHASAGILTMPTTCYITAARFHPQ